LNVFYEINLLSLINHNYILIAIVRNMLQNSKTFFHELNKSLLVEESKIGSVETVEGGRGRKGNKDVISTKIFRYSILRHCPWYVDHCHCTNALTTA